MMIGVSHNQRPLLILQVVYTEALLDQSIDSLINELDQVFKMFRWPLSTGGIRDLQASPNMYAGHVPCISSMAFLKRVTCFPVTIKMCVHFLRRSIQLKSQWWEMGDFLTLCFPMWTSAGLGKALALLADHSHVSDLGLQNALVHVRKSPLHFITKNPCSAQQGSYGLWAVKKLVETGLDLGLWLPILGFWTT